jgi:hypothetical protein
LSSCRLASILEVLERAVDLVLVCCRHHPAFADDSTVTIHLSSRARYATSLAAMDSASLPQTPSRLSVSVCFPFQPHRPWNKTRCTHLDLATLGVIQSFRSVVSSISSPSVPEYHQSYSTHHWKIYNSRYNVQKTSPTNQTHDDKPSQ